jgi:hypothetical protein
MSRYRIAITAQLTAPDSVDAARVRLLAKGTLTQLAPDMVRIVLERGGRDAHCAAERAFIDISRALAPSRFLRPPVWTARQLGLLGLGRRSSGRLSIGGDDDGLSGVREPRRPLPSTGSASVALDLPGI